MMRSNLLARMDPRAKLAAFLAVQALLFIPSSRPLPARLLYVAAGLLVLLPWAGRSWRLWLRIMAMVAPFLAFLAISAWLFPVNDRGRATFAIVLPLIAKTLLVALSLALFIANEEFWRWLQALRQLRLAAAAVVVLAIGHRFAGQWGLELEGLRRALTGRNFRALPWQRRAVCLGSALPLFFERLFDGAVHVHDAMVSRGFCGTLPPRQRLVFSIHDAVFLSIVAAAVAAVALLS